VQALSVRCKDAANLSAFKCHSHCSKALGKATEQCICTLPAISAFCDGTLERPLDLQGLGYVFWANVTSNDVDGDDGGDAGGGRGRGGSLRFHITGVRAGSYSLWVRLPGCLPVQQLLVPMVTVQAGAETTLGRVVVPNQQHALRRLWQIGHADASVAEFRRGKEAMDHGWMLWLHYSHDFPKGLHFQVGSSDPATDWNFMQPLLAASNASSSSCQSCPPLHPAPLSSLESTWRVSFATAALRGGYKRLALTVGILSANGHATGIDLILNGRLAGRVNSTAFEDSENGKVVRTHVDIRAWVLSGSQPPFQAVLELSSAEVAALPAQSTLELRLVGPYFNGCTDVQCPSASVLYDFIRLEGDPV
jgi:hypothetical protein